MHFGSVFSVTGISFLLLSVFAVAVSGYFLGRVKVKGVCLGAAGVFITALLFGGLAYGPLSDQLAGEGGSYAGSALKIVENVGLALFVSSVGFIAGPNFFSGLRRNFRSYFLLALLIIAAATLSCIFCIAAFGCDPAMAVGILSGALTSTPGFSAAKETVAAISKDPAAAQAAEDMVTVGHGIAYLFGVVSKVLFVQLVPKLIHADMAEERKKLVVVNADRTGKPARGLLRMDSAGCGAVALAALCGLVIGGIRIPLGHSTFSLGFTGGTLLSSLVLAHFGHIGKLDVSVPAASAGVFRELGLMLFLVGAGIAGGAKFVDYFKGVYFLYGVLMTVVPLCVGYLFARKALKLSLLNSLGAICGGMTSTPALGTLIETAGTADVASAYAATYPIALVLIVLASQFTLLLF